MEWTMLWPWMCWSGTHVCVRKTCWSCSSLTANSFAPCSTRWRQTSLSNAAWGWRRLRMAKQPGTTTTSSTTGAAPLLHTMPQYWSNFFPSFFPPLWSYNVSLILLGYWWMWSSISWITWDDGLRRTSETPPTGPPSGALAAPLPSLT